ncbi:MAG TPA: hypothetical protein VHO69_03735 [Phototrophicaceae bacterium]|nr:hypothetical protein [Phototrophicaceae bacterium]
MSNEQKPLLAPPIWKSVIHIPSVLLIVILVLVFGILASLLLISTNIGKNPILVTVVFNPTATYEPPGFTRTNVTYISSLASATPAATPFDPLWEYPPCSDVVSSTEDKIVFRIWLQRSMELFRMDGDGGNICSLTKDNFVDDQPKWSPDGQQIVFVSTRDGYGIYTMVADGTNITRLTTGGSAYSFPAWSPDGQQIIFQATIDEKFDLYVMNADGTKLRNLTNDPRLDISPAWSPDGQYITFASDRTFNPFIPNRLSQEDNYEIYLMDSEGLNVQRLTSNDVLDAFPAWSPDSQRITFVSHYQEIYVMNKDGSGLQFLTNGDMPVWLLDGQRIIFTLGGVPNVINIDGTGLKQLSTFSSEYFDYWTAH